MNKKVSIIIPTYGRPDMLSRAIDSALKQTYTNIEVIVVDDNDPNTDGREQTESLMHKYEYNEKVIYVKHKQNLNGSAARNTGFRNSTGNFIMFLDDDDEFLPNKVYSQLNCLESLDNEWGACYCRYKRVKGQKTIMRCGEKRQGYLLADELGRNLFVHAGSNLMIRRSVVSEIGGFDESFRRNQDIEFLARVLSNYKLAYTNELGLIVHVHGKRSSSDFIEVTQQYINKFQAAINNLDINEKKRVCTLINLQLARYYLTKKKDIHRVIVMLKEKDITLSQLVRYIVHLCNRAIAKRSYGFKL